jgi:flagellar motor switch protein FliM
MDPKDILTEDESQALRDNDNQAPESNESAPRPAGVSREIHADQWERIIADQVPALESISERMVSLLKTTGRRFFRQSVEVVAERNRPERWGAYARMLSVPTSLNVLDIKSLDLKGVVCLEADFVFTLVDIFFGGTGNGSRSIDHMEFTPMEVRLVRNFVTRVIADMKQAWRPFINLDIDLGTSETNPIFASVAAGSDPVSISSFTFQYGEKELRMEIVLPASVVEPIRFLRDSGVAEGSHEESRKWHDRLQQDVQDASVSLRAVLTEMEISLRELTMAKPGDTIPTDIPSTVTIYADNRPLMEGTFGVYKGHNAVHINKLMNQRLLGEKYGRHEND